MDRIPLSDETVDADEDLVEDEGSPGKEEQFKELDFDKDPRTEYSIPVVDEFEDNDDWQSDDLDDDFIRSNDL